jgi:hypothetical protein
MHELGRHSPLQPLVPCLPDDAHPAATHPVDQAVAAGNEILRRAHCTFPRSPAGGQHLSSLRRVCVTHPVGLLIMHEKPTHSPTEPAFTIGWRSGTMRMWS